MRILRDREQSGVALVITLIMLAVVTFLAVAYLAMSRREQSSINAAEEQNRARLMAEAAFDHLKAKVIANILTYTNAGSYDLQISTNLNNPERNEFRARVAYPYEGYLTNVCLYDTNGLPIPWSAENLRVSLGNLQVAPTAPVFYDVVENNRHTNDFRFYLDFNRNGRFDMTRQTNDGGTGMVRTLQWGDPQWVGVLENPNLPHSPSNRFVGRFAYVGVPVGKTLDINYINNNTKKKTQDLNNYGYQRGQGVGSWEINLAAFFRELNPLQWESEDYIYYSDENTYNRGKAFSDALEVLKYRYKNDYNNLAALSDETWIPRQTAYDRMGQLIFKGNNLNIDRTDVLDRFRYDLADTYSDGPLQLTAYRTGDSSSQWDAWDNEDRNRLNDYWAGSDNPRKLFDIQELVDDSKFSQEMVARLQGTYKNKAFTDQQHYLTNDVAFYRLLSQLSADSVYTADDRIPLNYTTVASPGYTNFIPWTANALTASNFFQITANRLLQQQFSKDLNEIQIYPTNQYTAGVHQLLQLTANIYDAMTNQAPSSGRGPSLPSVFRPIYRVDRGKVYLDSYEMVTNNVEDLLDKNTFVKIVPTISGAGDSVRHPNVTVSTFGSYTDIDGKIRMNLIGMPWIIAARKGYPNFNEQEVLTDIQLTRKIGLTRRNAGSIFNVQDMWVQYVLSISNRLAFEGWNSYMDRQYEFRRPLKLYMTNQVTTALWKNGNVVKVSTATNNYGMPTRYSNYVSRILSTNITANDLRTWEEGTFKTMTSSNLVFVPSSIIETHQSGGATYSTNSGIVTLEPKNPASFYKGANFLAGGPLYMTMTNRITYIAIDAENNWLVDYVNIEKTNLFNITGLIQGNTVMSGTDSNDNGLNKMLWDPNFGIQRQIEISLGNVDDQNTWIEYGAGLQNERDYQIQGFRQFCGLTNSLTARGMPDMQGAYRQTPYNPTAHKLVIESLQANDPLVHYHLGDLVNFTNVFTPLRANQENQENTQEDPSNIGIVNTFYVPWGGNPDKDITGYRESVNQVGLKDPNVTCSDDWDFPTNYYGRPYAYPTIGWLGKVHRGTPWQTVYLKADAVSDETWTKWSGRSESHPTNDWRLMDTFTAAINKNAARGLLSVNQTNMAAWAAVLGGVQVLTSTNDMATIEPQSDRFHKLVQEINTTRNGITGGAFRYQGEILAAKSLTTQSPYLGSGVSSDVTDAVMEWIPMQIMSLLREDKPAYLVYAYGQALVPAPGAIVLAPGKYRGMATNYVVTAEYATKTVFRVENAPLNPKVVIDSFDILPME
ncbi:MAG: hypothetical protein IKQ24_01975 [Verrucomicrobia bacterium]|nr:hypothetical protein [Verrucomicrobiota bacterium]